jgi:HEAT repeat protein
VFCKGGLNNGKSINKTAISRFALLNSGIPQALGAIGVIEQLVTLMSTSANEPVRGAAAIALGFLSYNYECRRLLLQR